MKYTKDVQLAILEKFVDGILERLGDFSADQQMGYLNLLRLLFQDIRELSKE